MTTRSTASMTCPNCRSPFTAVLEQIIDAQANPEAKSRLISGHLNTVICPHCGFQGGLNAPFLYHDAELEIAFIYAPLEIGTTDADRQKVIGNLTNALMQQLPAEARKGYLLQPRTFLSPESLVEAILEQDQETREMVETQRRKVELLDQLRQIDPEDRLAVAGFVGANDAELDEMFFQLLDLVIDIAQNQGNAADHDRLAKHQETLLEKSSTGQLFKAQQAAVETLAANPTRETLIEQLVASEAQEVREALVLAGRQLLDYAFFQTLTARIEATKDAATKEKLIALRKEVQEIRDQVDAVTMAVLNTRAELLKDLMLADNPREVALRRLAELDTLFFNVLSANVQQAESEGNTNAAQRLRAIGDIAVGLLNELAPPEVKLINRLMTAEDNEQIQQLLAEERERLNEDFLQLVEQAKQDLIQQNRQHQADRLRYAASQIKDLIAA